MSSVRTEKTKKLNKEEMIKNDTKSFNEGERKGNEKQMKGKRKENERKMTGK